MDPLSAGALSGAVIDAIASRLAWEVAYATADRAAMSEFDAVSEGLIALAGTLAKQLWMVRA
jgi:hypothetical protein